MQQQQQAPPDLAPGPALLGLQDGDSPQSPAGAQSSSSPRTQPIGYYSLNVLLNTILFVCIFVTGGAWTAAASQKVAGDQYAWKMMVFAAIITLVTFGLSVAFGELTRVNRNINVNVQGLLTPSA